jgi:hypothetical protein
MRQLIILLALVCLAAMAPGAERAIALHTYGDGLTAPVMVMPDQVVTSGAQLAELKLLDAPGSALILNPGTALRLQQRETPAGTSLVIALDSGAVQVSISDKGRYADVHVIGGAIDVRVTGTLFIVERTRRDSDYVALIRGKVTVRLRQEVAEAVAAGTTDHLDLESQQGVGGGPGGLGKIDALTGRPQLGAGTASIKVQGTTGTGGWDTDAAQDTIDGNQLGTLPTDGLGDDISSHISDAIGNNIEAQITGEVINQTLGGAAALGLPPGPPF